jgi:hypothetical protein
MVSARTGSHQDYARWRSRQIAYGRWEPWAGAGPVREHVRQLRRAGASYQAIAQAAGVSAMTVHRLVHGRPRWGRSAPERIHSSSARRLLAVDGGVVRGRRCAAGSWRRLRALVALGHAPVSLARQISVPPRQVCASWVTKRGPSARPWTPPSAVCTTSCGTSARRSARGRNTPPRRPPAAGPSGKAGRRRWRSTMTRSMIRPTGREPAAGQPLAQDRRHLTERPHEGRASSRARAETMAWRRGGHERRTGAGPVMTQRRGSAPVPRARLRRSGRRSGRCGPAWRRACRYRCSSNSGAGLWIGAWLSTAARRGPGVLAGSAGTIVRT